MTQEDKELLLKDLCARLPYGVKVGTLDNDGSLENIWEVLWNNTFTEDIKLINSIEDADKIIDVSEIRPYLFPLSSMTEEQRMELNSLLPVGVSLQINSNNFTYFEINTDLVCYFHIEFWDKFFDWLYKYHIDFRGLIEKSLALDATNLNIY